MARTTRRKRRQKNTNNCRIKRVRKSRRKFRGGDYGILNNNPVRVILPDLLNNIKYPIVKKYFEENKKYFEEKYVKDNVPVYREIFRISNENTIYYGEIENKKPSGRGTMTYENGDIYVGEWKDDKRNGQGKMTYINPQRYGVDPIKSNEFINYEGEWKDDKRNGRGKITYANGKTNESLWENDEFKQIIYTATARSVKK